MSSDVQVTWISVVLFCTSDIEGRWIDSLILLILHLFRQASAFSSSHNFLVHSLSNLSSHSGTVGSVFGPVTDGNTWKLTCYMELSSSPPTPPKKQVSARMSGVLFSLMTRPYNWQLSGLTLCRSCLPLSMLLPASPKMGVSCPGGFWKVLLGGGSCAFEGPSNVP